MKDNADSRSLWDFLRGIPFSRLDRHCSHLVGDSFCEQGVIFIIEGFDSFGVGFRQGENWYIIVRVIFVTNFSFQQRKSIRGEMIDS